MIFIGSFYPPYLLLSSFFFVPPFKVSSSGTSLLLYVFDASEIGKEPLSVVRVLP
jgi:hypothetical protein